MRYRAAPQLTNQTLYNDQYYWSVLLSEISNWHWSLKRLNCWWNFTQSFQNVHQLQQLYDRSLLRNDYDCLNLVANHSVSSTKQSFTSAILVIALAYIFDSVLSLHPIHNNPLTYRADAVSVVLHRNLSLITCSLRKCSFNLIKLV